MVFDQEGLWRNLYHELDANYSWLAIECIWEDQNGLQQLGKNTSVLWWMATT